MKGNALLFLVLIVFILDLFFGIPLGSLMNDSINSGGFIVISASIVRDLKNLIIGNVPDKKVSIRIPEEYLIYFFNPGILKKDNCEKIAEIIVEDSGLKAIVENNIKIKNSERLKERKLAEFRNFIKNQCLSAGDTQSVICIIKDYRKYKENSNLIPPNYVEFSCQILPALFSRKTNDEYSIFDEIFVIYHNEESVDLFSIKNANESKFLNTLAFDGFIFCPHSKCKTNSLKLNEQETNQN